MASRKTVQFCGDSLAALRLFPESARRRAGAQIDRVQLGLDPDDWKPMSTVGVGVREIRVRDEHGIFRVIYVATFGERVFVLHCFQKKTQKTSRSDLNLATKRYRDVVKEETR